MFIEAVFDSKVLMRVGSGAGIVLFVFFVYYYVSKEGRDERGRGIIATACFVSFMFLFIMMNVLAFFITWASEMPIRISNIIQILFDLSLLIADVYILIARKIR